MIFEWRPKSRRPPNNRRDWFRTSGVLRGAPSFASMALGSRASTVGQSSPFAFRTVVKSCGGGFKSLSNDERLNEAFAELEGDEFRDGNVDLIRIDLVQWFEHGVLPLFYSIPSVEPFVRTQESRSS